MLVGGAWSFGWTALVAIATLALAVVTSAVAVLALRALTLARRSLEAVEEGLRASLLPMLEPVPPYTGKHKKITADRIDYTSLGGPTGDRWSWPYAVDVLALESGVFCSIPVRNVGPGVAKIATEVAARALSVPDEWWSTGEPTRGLVPPGERTRVQFRLPGVRDELYVEVDYADTSDGQRRRLRLYLMRSVGADGESAFHVLGSATYRLTSTGPILFAAAGDERVTRRSP
jgi:hypothetical protein